MLVNADTGGVDHDNLAVESLGNRSEQPIPDPGFAPSHEPVLACGVGTISLRHICPGRSGPETPKNAVENLAVVNTRHTTNLTRQVRLDYAPFKVAQLVTAHSDLQKKP